MFSFVKVRVFSFIVFEGSRGVGVGRRIFFGEDGFYWKFLFAVFGNFRFVFIKVRFSVVVGDLEKREG